MLISRHGSVVSGVNGPVEAKERDQDPSGQIVQVTLHPPTGQQVGPVHRQIEETIRGLVENMLVKEAHPSKGLRFPSLNRIDCVLFIQKKMQNLNPG